MEKKTNGMSVAAIVLAFIFPVVGLILAIIAKKKDSEDKIAKVAFVISLVFLIVGFVSAIGCFGCSVCVIANSDDSTPTSQTVKITTTVADTETIPVETEIEVTTVTPAETTATTPAETTIAETTKITPSEVTTTEKIITTTANNVTTNQEEIYESVRYLIETVVSSSGYSKSSVTYDGEYDIYTINVQMNGVAEAVMNIKYGISGSISDWNGVRENAKLMCNSTRGFVRESGLKSHVVINVLNDASPDNVLLCIMDGEIVYDVLAE